MVNKESSVGIVEDLITHTMHMVGTEYHLNILVRKYEDMIKYWYADGNTEYLSTKDLAELEETEAKLVQTISMLKEVTEARREAMRAINKHSNETGNKDLWCTLKHILCGCITAFEVWQVNLDDLDTKEHFLNVSRIANQVIASFLGYEVTPCSACLADSLKEDNK